MRVANEYPVSSALGEKAVAIAGLVDNCAPYADEHGELAPALVERLHDDRLFGMWVPHELGGSELSPVPSLEVIEQISYADASAGWVVMAANLSIGTAGAYLSDRAAKELFSDERFPVIAGQGTRPGTAITDGDGYRLSGSWSFGSGLMHGTHIHSLGIIAETGEPRIFVTPVSDAELLGNWDVLGLRGTGSIDYRMDNVFVHDDYSHFAVTEQPLRGGNLYHVGIIGFAEMCHQGWALGLGRRMLDELAALANDKAGRPGASAASDSFLEGLGNAEGSFRAARALVYEQWTEASRALDRGEHLSARQHTLIRLALTHVTHALHEIGNHVYLAAGTTALRDGRLQQMMRDTHAGTQHVTSSPAVVQNVGRMLSGLASDKKWQFLDLVDA
jgi:indole-3-acetate monooxygenase